MADLKTMTLVLDMDNEQDRNMYNGVVRFARQHNISEESRVLKAFISFLHFKGTDINRLSNRVKNDFSILPPA